MAIVEKDDYFQAGQPVHRLSYCAFLDVLGFAERITQSFEAKQGNQLLQEFHGILAKRIASLREDTDDTLLYFKSFTDNVILAHPQFSPDLESEFGFILWSISEYQFEMALRGFFIRGGLTVGPLFIDANSVYGPALLEAYKLESKVAVNPAVVLSDDVKALVLHHCTYYMGDEPPQNRDVLVNADGRFFINYLSECFVDTSESEEVYWPGLSTHKEQLEAALLKYRSKPEIFAKYSWLASYHNYFCEAVSRYPGYSAKVKVPEHAIQVQFKTLREVRKQ